MSISEKQAIEIGIQLAAEKNLVFDNVQRIPGDDHSPPVYIVECVDRNGEQVLAGFDGICKAILESDGSLIDFHLPVPE